MNDAIADFIEYLTQTKKYSAHTAIGYETDVRDFVTFCERFNGGPIFPKDLARTDTLMFRSYLADRQRRGLAHKSTARALSSLRGFFKFIAKNYGIKNDAITLISSPKVRSKIGNQMNEGMLAPYKKILEKIQK